MVLTKLKYEKMSLQELYTYVYYEFECDGDKKELVAKLKEEYK